MRRVLLLSLIALAAFAERTAVLTLGTLTATGQTAGQQLQIAAHKHTVQVIVTGAPATCSIQLDGTLDDLTNVASPTWSNLSGSQTCTSTTTFHVVERAVTAVRANLTILTGGSSPTVRANYVGVQ